MNRTLTVVLAVAVFAAAGCTNKKLIAEKDAEIGELQGDITQLQSEVEEQRRMNEELKTQLAGLEDEKRVWIEEKDNLTYITLDGAATFPSASAELSSEGRDVIDQVWDVVGNYPGRAILVEGHADSRPISPSYRHVYASNWELSSARAHSVIHYLIDKHDADPHRLAAVGYGENSPAADNDSPEGMAQNRRVVITIGSPKAIQELISLQELDASSLERAREQ